MVKERLARGLIQVYTGDGKGKTTCALGLALGAVGQGLQVSVAQFLKGRETGEFKAADRLSPEMTRRYFGRPGLVNLRSPAPADLITERHPVKHYYQAGAKSRRGIEWQDGNI